MTSFEIIILIVFMLAVVVTMVGVLGQSIELEIRDQRARLAARGRERRQRHMTAHGGHA